MQQAVAQESWRASHHAREGTGYLELTTLTESDCLPCERPVVEGALTGLDLALLTLEEGTDDGRDFLLLVGLGLR